MSDVPIPENIRLTARRIAFDLPSGVVVGYLESAADVVARAILAEREACALVAEKTHAPFTALAIRRGTP